jgi:hypothetical protein
MGAVQSQLASQRGLSAAQRARMASNQIAALQGQTAQQAGILGLQQQLAAQEQLGKLGTGAATLGSDAQLRGAGLLTGSSQELERMRQNIAAANQAAAAQDKARTVQAVTSVLGGASQVGAAYAGKAHGGRIDGVAPYAGDTPKNDVVPANLSPGEIVIPRSAAMSKKDAKKFIDALDDWDEEPSYGKVLKARQKKNYADGGMIPNDEQMMQEAGQAYLEKQRAPYPMVEKAKGAFDEFLASRVVEPLAQRGYPTLGAALATVPSTAMEAMVPSTPDELMQTVIPFPGAKLTKKAEKVIAEEGLEKTIAKQSLERGEKMKSKLAEQVLAEKQKKIPSKEQRPKLRDVNEQIDELSEPNWSESAVKDASEPYSGNIHNNVWQKDFASGVEQKPQLVGDLKGTLGKEVPKGGTDPFAWMDTKYGATKKALEQNYDKPLTINTRSDLIAHDDYIALLNPSKHKINIHVLSPENDRITRILEPGAPSTKRRLAAAKKLQDMGFDVTIVQDILKHPKLSENMRKDVSSFADLGEFHQRMNNMFLDDSAVERLKKVLGDYATKE